jgi:hypothetical protein
MFEGDSTGSFATVQHGEYSLMYIHLPRPFKSILPGTYFVPATLTVEQRRKLLGRLEERGAHAAAFFVKVKPSDLSLFLGTIGVSLAVCTNVARAQTGRTRVTVPLLTKFALGRVREGLPWPVGFPEIQIPPPPPPPPAPVAAPAPVGVRGHFVLPPRRSFKPAVLYCYSLASQELVRAVCLFGGLGSTAAVLPIATG